MSTAGHAALERAPEPVRAKPPSGGDCCAGELSAETGLPRFLAGAQTKLQVGAPGDAFEREADTVAEAVQRNTPVAPIRPASGTPRFQRLCAECADEMLAERNIVPGMVQRLAGEPEEGEAAGSDSVSGLAPSVRNRLEQSLGTRLGGVRVHTGPTAHALAQILGAKAFAHGEDIWLGARQRPEDLGLMAHEVAHVLQQTGGSGPVPAEQARTRDEDEASQADAPKLQEGSGDDGSEDAGEGGDNDAGSAAASGGAGRGDGDPGDDPGRGGGSGSPGDVASPGSPDPRGGRPFGAPVDARLAFAGLGLLATDHPVPAFSGAIVGAGRAGGRAFTESAEGEADGIARAVSLGLPARVQTRPGSSLQRKEKDAFDRALDWGAARLNQASSAVASGAKAVGEFAGEQLMRLLRTVAPQVADIIDEGPINFAKRKINEALDAHLPAALGGFSLGQLIDAVSGWLGEAASFAKSLMTGDAKACAAFASVMEKLTQFVTKLIDNPVIKTFNGALTKVSEFIGKAIKFVAAPVFDALAAQVSGAWSVMKKVAFTVSRWISSAKSAIGGLWDQLMKALGFDGSSEDGVWAHIKKVGGEIWETIKTKMAPVIEPMKKVVSVISLLTPMGQIHAVVKYGPKVVKVAQWVWDNGLNPAKIREAPAEIRGMLTDLTGGVNGFKGVLQSGLDWLSEKVSSLADAVLGVVGSITGLPLIGFAHGLFDEAKKTLKTLVADIVKGAKDALAAIEATATKISDFISPYKEVISSLILAIVSPPMIPVILAGWAWRALPSCVKVPILNFILDIAIAALRAIPEVPTFGVLWPLLKPGVMSFLGTLRAAEDKVKELVSDKIAKIISGASPEFLIGFVKGFAIGVWEGITDPFKLIWMVLEGLDSATQYLLSLAGVGEETVATKQPAASAVAPAAAATATVPATGAVPAHVTAATAPAATSAAAPETITAVAPAPAAPVAAPPAEQAAGAEQPYVADPAAALQSGAAMPESTRQLLEKLATEQAAAKAAEAKEAEQAEPAGAGGEAATSVAPQDVPALKERASAVAGEISPDVETVKGGFWDAVQEYFSGDGMSFDDMVTKLSEAWESAKTKISQGAAWLANKLMGFFRGGGAEGELGDKIGWLTGTITFQVLLDYITAGTWAAAGPVLKAIARFINWPMEALGQAFKMLKTLGKYLLDGLKSLGSVIKDAAAGAFKTVSKALGNIGQRLIAFGEEILGKFGGKAAKAETKAAGMLGKEGAKVAEQKVGKQALSEAEEKAAQKLEQQAGKVKPHPSAEPKPEPTAQAPKTGETMDVDQVPAESAAKREASVAESGHVESDKLTPRQARNETDQFRNRPESLEGAPPHRKSKAGEHEWREETLPNGESQFCRFSKARVCVDTPELRASELKNADENAVNLQKQADAQAKAAADARERAAAHQPLSPDDEKYLNDAASEATERAEAAKKRLGPERGKVTKANKAGKVDKATAAQKRVEVLEAEVKRAEEQAQTAKEMLTEQQRLLQEAEKAESLAKAMQEEAQKTAGKAGHLKDLEKKVADAEQELAQLRKEWPATRMRDPEVHLRMNKLENEIIPYHKGELAKGIEAAKGFTPEARKVLREGTPFGGVGGKARKEAFLGNLPAEARGPNGTYIDYVTGDALPLSKLEVDHVVSVDEIFGMKGFGDLPRVDQKEILEMEENLRHLEAGRNASKQESKLSAWLASDAPKAPPALPAARQQALADLEAKCRSNIEAEIAKRLKKMKVP